MSIVLTDGTATVTLPGGLEWTDEHSWTPVVQQSEHALDGALLVDVSAKLAGREITLEGADDRGWTPLSDVAQLKAWAAVPGKTLTLTLKGATRTVMFRHQDGALEARAMFGLSTTDADWPHVVTLRLMEI